MVLVDHFKNRIHLFDALIVDELLGYNHNELGKVRLLTIFDHLLLGLVA
jgi:hypothetical protein